MSFANEVKMDLTGEERSILEGIQGPVPQKILKSVIMYGEAFGADRLLPITGASHQVISLGSPGLALYYGIVQQFVDAGLKLDQPFTVDPRPIHPAMVEAGLMTQAGFDFMKPHQEAYEKQLMALGLKNEDAFTCTCYLEEVGNIPRKGDVLAWSESSAVVYANSVLGARTNRNSGGLDIMCSLAGKAPRFDLLTDEGRQASWLIELKTETLPNAQLLGSAIGLRVMEAVPYITGLAELMEGLPQDARTAFLKDMGAASASNGAVGLYHVEGLTPEALDQGQALLKPGFKTFTITEETLAATHANYPQTWDEPSAAPDLALIGCPHLSLTQLEQWSRALLAALDQTGRQRVGLKTALFAAPGVIKAFEAGEPVLLKRLKTAGIGLSPTCPLMFMNNPMNTFKAVITNSNKLRTYSQTRFLMDEEVLEAVVTGGLKGGA